MPSPQPIKLYLDAVAAYREGNNEKAARLLAESLGVKEPSPVMENNIDKIFNENTMPNYLVLQVLATEVAKGVRDARMPG